MAAAVQCVPDYCIPHIGFLYTIDPRSIQIYIFFFQQIYICIAIIKDGRKLAGEPLYLGTQIKRSFLFVTT